MIRYLLYSIFLICNNYNLNAQEVVLKFKNEKSLVALWDFSIPSTGGGWKSNISETHFLQFGADSVGQVYDSELNRQVAEFQEGQWLMVPRKDLGDLNIYGKNASLTILALVKKQSDKNWQAVAGVWDESRSKRQYYLFLNASSKTHQDDFKRYPSKGLIHGHISALGGKTPGEVAWISYASSGKAIPVHSWTWIALTYDGKKIKVFENGDLQKDPLTNPFDYSDGIYNGGDDGADFTVGANSVAGRMTNQFLGRISHIVVFEKALSEKKIQKFQDQLYQINHK